MSILSKMLVFASAVILVVHLALTTAKIANACKNSDMNCATWVAESPDRCKSDELVAKECRLACGTCDGARAQVEERECRGC